MNSCPPVCLAARAPACLPARLLPCLPLLQLDDVWQSAASAMRAKLLKALGPEQCSELHIIGRSRKQKVMLDTEHVLERMEVAGKTYEYMQVCVYSTVFFGCLRISYTCRQKWRVLCTGCTPQQPGCTCYTSWLQLCTPDWRHVPVLTPNQALYFACA
jgi:hypothetical protein